MELLLLYLVPYIHGYTKSVSVTIEQISEYRLLVNLTGVDF